MFFIVEERRNLYDKLTFEACSGLGLTVGSEIVLSILLLGMRDHSKARVVIGITK